jgi:hypothetical protein
MIQNNSFHFRALSSLGLVVLLLTIVLESADAAAGISPIVACETFTLLCGPSQDVCFTIEYYTPSPAATIDANGTNATFYEMIKRWLPLSLHEMSITFVRLSKSTTSFAPLARRVRVVLIACAWRNWRKYWRKSMRQKLAQRSEKPLRQKLAQRPGKRFYDGR